MKNYSLISILASIGMSFAMASVAMEMPETNSKSSQIQRIEQPIPLKIGVAVGGMALIGAQLWWFLMSKPKSGQAETNNGVQEVSITVDGGYIPSQVTVKRGQPVRLKFLRRDPNSCLDKVLFPEFHIAQDLVLNETTPVEFTPETVGNYEFSCGMGMFHGAIAVEE